MPVVIADLNFLDQLVRKLQCDLSFALFGAFGAVNLERVDRAPGDRHAADLGKSCVTAECGAGLANNFQRFVVGFEFGGDLVAKRAQADEKYCDR